MDREPFQSNSDSEDESENDSRDNDNKSLILKNYCGVNEFCLEDSGITREYTYLNYNNSFHSYINPECNKGMNSSFLNKKRIIKNNDLENYNFDENKKEEIGSIDDKEDKLSSFKKFENNENKKEEKGKNRIKKKEERERENLENNKENNIKKQKRNVVFKISKIKGEKKKITKFGRKKQEEKDQGKNGLHTRDDEDNKIRKIKSYFGKEIYNFIKGSFIEENEFMKLEISINKKLKKEFNEGLFKMKLKDIYYKYGISVKYVHYDKDTNKKLINKIYKEQKEIAVIKILNLTYIEAFDIFRRKIKEEKDINQELKNKIIGTDFLDNKKFKDFDCLIEKIREEEKKHNNGDIEEYINDIKRLCLHFEEWFSEKKGRNRD